MSICRQRDEHKSNQICVCKLNTKKFTRKKLSVVSSRCISVSFCHHRTLKLKVLFIFLQIDGFNDFNFRLIKGERKRGTRKYNIKSSPLRVAAM